MNQSGTTQSGGMSGTGTGDIKPELKEDGAKLTDTAKQKANAIAEENKGKATGAVRATASAIDKAADELKQDGDAPTWLSSAFKQAASSASDLASRVDNKDPGEIANEVSRFAKDSPAAFLAMSSMAGFAVSRFLKAGAEHRDTGSDFGGRSRLDKPYKVDSVGSADTPGNTSTGTSSIAGTTL